VNLKQVEQNEDDLWKENKKIEVIGAPPLYWPWFECFDNISFSKINGIPNAIYQGVRVMNFEIEGYEC
jgi:hypothetical protein